MLDVHSGDWALNLLEKMNIPHDMLTGIINPGTVMGKVSGFVCDELGVNSVPVISVAEHDTGSAVMSVPSERENTPFRSAQPGRFLVLNLPSL
jgi:sugar (pentulose or hexulose) kinase